MTKRGQTRKAVRMRLAKSEILLDLAVTVTRWGTLDTGISSFDACERLCKTYDLTEADYKRICDQLGDELERRSMRSGFEEIWLGPE